MGIVAGLPDYITLQDAYTIIHDDALRQLMVNDIRNSVYYKSDGEYRKNYSHTILQTAGIYSDLIRKASCLRSAVGSYRQFNRCAVYITDRETYHML